ncbi:MAG: ethanolamine utilization protein EutN [Candidatus Hydrogenedentota bacterium]|nr:MAG: ethanolamine utilization protein EutN [Candidatus Hydrogenedentota bacterium]
MKLGRVTGTVVCTQKLSGFEGQKFLLVQPMDEKGNPLGDEIIANDVAQAGQGDIVLFETGREGAYALPKPKDNVSDACILAVVDQIYVAL